MSSIPNIIDDNQFKQILASLTEKTKKLFATKSELNAQVAALTEELNSLKARVEELESSSGTVENPDGPSGQDDF